MSSLTNLSSSNCSTQACQATANTEHAPAVKPVYKIQEAPEAWSLVVQLPGVNKENLEITADHEQVRIVGRRTWTTPESWTSLYRETENAPFELVISHDNVVDIEKVHAELRDGVLRASLPKGAEIKPRKVVVS